MDSEMVPAEVPPEPMDCDEALEPRLGLVDLLSGPEGSELASLCGLLLRLEELSEVVGVSHDRTCRTSWCGQAGRGA